MRHLPNIITLGNLLCGCMAIIAIFNAKLEYAGVLVLIAAVLDFLDGFLARLLKAYSEIGKQLDSLADMVTFGVVPGLMLYTIFYMGAATAAYSETALYIGQHTMLLVTLFSALRLAKFNIDTRQTSYFIGVPTPANTLIVISFAFILGHDEFGLSPIIYHPGFLIGFALVSSWLLVAEIPLLSLKFKSYDWNSNKGQYLLLIIALVSMVLFRYAAMPVIIIFYVILSLIFPPNKQTT